MTTSPKPWTCKYDPVSDTTNVFDAQGKFLAVFWDGRNADEMLRAFNAAEEADATILELENRVDTLRSEVRDLNWELKQVS